MEKTKDLPLTGICYAMGIVLGVLAFFFGKPVNVLLAILALACMFRVVAVAFLEKLSWKTIVFRLTLVAGIVTEITFFYDFFIGKIIFGGLFGIGALISFWNFLVFMNTLPRYDDLDK